MKKTCNICNKIHDINKICKRQYHKKLNTQEVSFRNSYSWKTKRTQIKIRDLYLCRVCLQNKMISKDKFNHQNIQVHISHLGDCCSNPLPFVTAVQS